MTERSRTATKWTLWGPEPRVNLKKLDSLSLKSCSDTSSGGEQETTQGPKVFNQIIQVDGEQTDPADRPSLGWWCEDPEPAERASTLLSEPLIHGPTGWICDITISLKWKWTEINVEQSECCGELSRNEKHCWGHRSAGRHAWFWKLELSITQLK